MKKRSIDEEFSQQLPDALPKDWKMLEGQLELSDIKRRLRGLLWAFPLALVALTGFSGWQSYELLHTRKRLEVLEKVVESNKKSTALDDASDTPHHRIMVYDTIYLTTVIRDEPKTNGMNTAKILPPGLALHPEKTANRPIKPLTTNLTADEINFTSIESDSQPQNELKMSLDQKHTLNSETISGKGLPETSTDSTLKAIQNATVELPDSETRSETRELSVPNSSPESSSTQQAKHEAMAAVQETSPSIPQPQSAEQDKVRKHKPLSVDAGVGAGLLFPLAEGIEESSRGFMAGLRVKMKYSPHWSVVFDAQRNNMSFHQEGEHAYALLPDVTPPIPQARLQEAEVYEYSSWQFGLGVQYTLLDRFRWKPYVRLGWALQKPTHYLIEYKFLDKGNEQIESYYTFRNQPHIADIVQGAAGVSYGLGERLTASAEATYQQQVGYSRDTPNVLGIRASVLYRLSKNK